MYFGKMLSNKERFGSSKRRRYAARSGSGGRSVRALLLACRLWSPPAADRAASAPSMFIREAKDGGVDLRGSPRPGPHTPVTGAPSAAPSSPRRQVSGEGGHLTTLLAAFPGCDGIGGGGGG